MNELVMSDDPRALAAGRAMATWAWAKAYTLAHGLDGFLPRVALAASWVGERQALKDVAVLTGEAVGLLMPADGGWVLDAAEEAPPAIAPEKRSAAAIRSQRYRNALKAKAATATARDGERDASRVTGRDDSQETSRDTSRSLARSRSDLGSGSSSLSGLSPDLPDSPPCPKPDLLTHPPAWREEVVLGLDVAMGRKPKDEPQCWARFVTTSQRDARAITPEAWKAFVVMQLGYDAADARKNPNRVRAVQRDERPPAYEKATPEDHEAHLDELIAEAKKGATGS